MLDIKVLLTKILNRDVTVDYIDVPVASTAKGANSSNTEDVTKSGYTPLGIVGHEWQSGTRQNYFNIWNEWISGNNYYLRCCNLHSSDAASGTLRVYILYKNLGGVVKLLKTLFVERGCCVC